MSGTRVDAGTADLIALAQRGPVHFVGVCGAGMSALAELLLRAGGQVSGCDARPGAVGDNLRRLGLDVRQGHDPDHVQGAVAVVTTAAVPPEHPELAEARALGIPILKRAQALAELVSRGRVLAIAGTHGKTTTTAMATAMLSEAGFDPTGFVGGRVEAWGGGLRPGSGEVFVVEADEYDRSFLTLRPEIAVVTTVEADHLDIYGTAEAVEDAFAEFASAVVEEGRIVACCDDAGARRLLERVGARGLSYGTDPAAEVRAVSIEMRGGTSRFVVVERGIELGELILGVPGLHNVRNALGAFAACRLFGIELDAARRALYGFAGVGRRFQVLGEAAGVLVVDDYAHHPTEVEATIAAARGAWPGRRVVAVFQPHLYSRTRDFARGFGSALAQADEVWVTDVYAAREAPIEGVNGDMVVGAVRAAGGPQVRYHPALDGLAEAVAGALGAGDVCLLMGAGDIDAAARSLLRILEEAR
jgi:UDP-N-acetylmuramate--alanine ligase